MFGLFKKKRKNILSNNTLTVTLISGSQLVFNNATRSQFDFCDNTENDDESIVEYYYSLQCQKEEINRTKQTSSISQIIYKKEEKKAEEQKNEVKAKAEIVEANTIKQSYPLLVESGDFTERDGALYMNKIPLSVPKLLVNKFLQLIIRVNNNDAAALDEYCALKNFWMWTSLCPSAESRESMFKYMANNSLKINKYGFFFAYRKVVSVGPDMSVSYKQAPKVSTTPDKELSEFISNTHMKIKGWKKNPKNFVVWRVNDEYKYYSVDKDDIEGTCIGNLNILYLGLSEQVVEALNDTIAVQTYTDQNSHSMDIRIGKETSINPANCDWNVNNECSRGLHISGSKDYGCGDTPILVLVNPMKVVACPYNDGHKMRVWAYLPVAVVKENERGTIADNLDTLELGTEYYENGIKELNDKLKNNTPQELIQHKYLSNLSPEALKIIAKETENIAITIKNRVIKG